MTNVTITDCRSETGVTVGLIDSLMSICHVLIERDLSPVEIREALSDLNSNEAVRQICEWGVSKKSYSIPPNGVSGLLRFLRKTSGLKLQQVAEITDLSVSFISEIERGVRVGPSFDSLNKLASAYGVQISVVFDGIRECGE